MEAVAMTAAAFPEFSNWSNMASKLVRYGLETGPILHNWSDMPSKLVRYAFQSGPIWKN